MSDSDLPLTTEDDLRKLGLTPEILRAKFESRGWVIKGKTHGFYLPKDKEWSKDLVKQARNTVLQQWTAVDQQPPMPVQQHVYNQTFENFDSETPSDFTFTNDTSVTTGTDYSLTNSYDISVNIGLNMGEVGHINISAGMSQQEVHNQSESKTVSHTVNFNVTCPAHGGKLVAETTTETASKTIFESKIGPKGTVCLATRDPNMYYIFFDINYIFPELYQVGRVVRTTVDTQIETSICDIARPQSGGTNQKILFGKGHRRTYLTHRTARAISFSPTSASLPIPLSQPPPVKDDPNQPNFNAILATRLVFNVAGNPLPAGQARLTAATQFRNAIVNAVAAGTIHGVGQITPWNFGPARNNPNWAQMDITYAEELVHEMDLEVGIRELTHHVNWGGHNYLLRFD